MDFSKIAKADRNGVWSAFSGQNVAYGRMEQDGWGRVPPAEGCGYPEGNEVSVATEQLSINPDLNCTINTDQLQKAKELQPCRELAVLIEAHERLHSAACVGRRPDTATWTWEGTNSDGSPFTKKMPLRLLTPAGRAAEEIAGYQLEIAGLKPIIDKLEKKCPKYRATGQTGELVYSGLICSLERPFTVTGRNAAITYPFEFTPGVDSGGTFSFSTNFGSLPSGFDLPTVGVEGGGFYTVEGVGTGNPRIAMTGSSSAHIPGYTDRDGHRRFSGASASGGGTTYIDLVPLDTDECNKW